ncbi:CHAT domain-containing protein [Geodermatophilus sp. SYSU D01062]
MNVRPDDGDALTLQDVRLLLERGDVDTVLSLSGRGLSRGDRRLSRAALLHARAIALAESAGGDLGEAIRCLEEAMCEPPEDRRQSEPVLGSLALHRAHLEQRRRRAGPVDLDPPLGRAQPLVAALVEGAGSLLSASRVLEAELLLSRAVAVAADSEGPAGARFRAGVAALRRVHEQLGQDPGDPVDGSRRPPTHRSETQVSGGTALPPQPVLRLLQRNSRESWGIADDARQAASAGAIEPQRAALAVALENARFSYTAQERNQYLEILRQLAGAARAGLLTELARRILMCGLDVYRRTAQAEGEREEYAEVLAWLGQVAVDAGAYGQAQILGSELDRLVASGGCRSFWARMALVVEGRALIALGDTLPGVDRIRAGVRGSTADDRSRWFVDGIRDLYGACLTLGDLEGASECHGWLAATGDPRGTSRQEIQARDLEDSDLAGAIDLYDQLLTSADQLPASGIIRISLRLGQILHDQGQDDRALGHLSRIYPLIGQLRGADHPSLSEVEELAASLESSAGRYEFALGAISRATARDSRTAGRQLAVSSSTQRDRKLGEFRRRIETMASLVVDHFRQDSEPVGGLFALVLRQKGVNTHVERQVQLDIVEQADGGRELDEARRSAAHLRARLSQEALRIRSGSQRRRQVEELLREREALERRMSILVGGLSLTGLTTYPDPVGIAMTIPEDSVYVDYYLHTSPSAPGRPPVTRYCAFVVPARTVYRWQVLDLGDAATIDRLVGQFRSTVTSTPTSGRDAGTQDETGPGSLPRDRDRDATRWGGEIRELVFDPLVPSFEGRTRLVVSPDGSLATLPFDCLPLGETEQVIDRYRLSYATSSRSVQTMDAAVLHDRTPEAAAACSAPLVMGAPAFDEPPTHQPEPPVPGLPGVMFRPLEGAENEVDQVGRTLGVAPLVGNAASKAALQATSSPVIVHLATHGFFLDGAEEAVLAEVPLLRSGIALAGANVGGSDGILLAEEVLSLPLRRTALVVLSACETGLGPQERGEGPASLGRSFEAAGAESVVVGLWKVPDEETTRLMASFYRSLVAGAGVADALREAKLELRRTHPHTFFWGAFISSGGWGSIATDTWHGGRPSAGGPDRS